MARTGILKFYGVAVCLVFLFLAGRLFELQVVMGQHYSDMSERNAIRLVTVPAPRGVLFDRHKRPIVASRMAYRVFLDLRDIKGHGKGKQVEFELLIELLWPIRGGDQPPDVQDKQRRDEFYKRVNDPKRRAFEPVVLMNDADAATVSRILEHKVDLPGVTVEEFPTRQYVHQSFASHLVGYLSEINSEELGRLRNEGYRMGDLIGKSGVEKVYESYLRGKNGGLQVEVNNLGNPIRVLGTKPPTPGNDVILTIDQDVQAAAEKAFEEHLVVLNEHAAPNAHSGAVVAMDPRNGQIIAMVSWPEFNPNVFVSSDMRSEIAPLFTNKLNPTMNRALYGVYPYGSTFKMVTATAALEEGKVTEYSRFYCSGVDPVSGKKCWTVGKGIVHGSQDLVAGIKNSCNLVFYELGRRLGPDRLAKWARAFGFGSPTGIELPGERSGQVPDRAWKKTISPYPWYPSESADYGIGQGYMSGTPIQLVRAYSALLNGGILYKPQIVSEVLGPDGKVVKVNKAVVQGRVPFSDKNAKMVRAGLEAVVREGTARTPMRGFPIPAGGKTGTAQNPPHDNHGWFMGYAPADKPEIVVVVLVEGGMSGAGGAAPIGRKVLDAYFGLDSAGVKTQANAGARAD